jgi:hypothetical protein
MAPLLSIANHQQMAALQNTWNLQQMALACKIRNFLTQKFLCRLWSEINWLHARVV